MRGRRSARPIRQPTRDPHPRRARRLAVTGHLVLVGLPGAGKSTVGPAVAQALGRPFLDFDAEVVRRTGQSVASLFAERGEGAFRSMEIELTDEVATHPPMVLAPGGGWITNPGVVDRLRPPGRLVHLRLTPARALARLQGSGVERPLLRTPDPLAALERLWLERHTVYATADWTLDVENLDWQEVAQIVASLARDHRPGIG